MSFHFHILLLAKPVNHAEQSANIIFVITVLALLNLRSQCQHFPRLIIRSAGKSHRIFADINQIALVILITPVETQVKVIQQRVTHFPEETGVFAAVTILEQQPQRSVFAGK